MLSILASSAAGTTGEEISWACTLVYRQLCRKLLPLLQRVFREMRDRDGGLLAEFERIAYWDDNEQARVTHGILLAEIPDLIWLIDLVLSMKSRRFSIVTSNLIPPMETPCVFFEPYMFVGDLFKSIVRQWKLSLPSPSSKLESRLSNVIEMNTLFQDCLNEWIEQNVPLRSEHRKSFTKLEQEHAILWTDIKLRHYIRHRSEWLKYLKQRHENEKKEALLPRDLHVWTQSTTVMKAAVDEMAKWTLALNKLRPMFNNNNAQKKKTAQKKREKGIENQNHHQDEDNDNNDNNHNDDEDNDDNNDDDDDDDDDNNNPPPNKVPTAPTRTSAPTPAPTPTPVVRKKNRLNWQRKAEVLLPQKTTEPQPHQSPSG